jgi:hypothetical protein
MSVFAYEKQVPRRADDDALLGMTPVYFANQDELVLSTKYQVPSLIATFVICDLRFVIRAKRHV